MSGDRFWFNALPYLKSKEGFGIPLPVHWWAH